MDDVKYDTTTELIVARRRRWKDALMLGAFKQGKNRLVDFVGAGEEKQYCCLGVACEVFKEDLGVEFYRGGEYTGASFLLDGENLVTILNLPMRKYLGLSPASQRILTIANDNGLSFGLIAEIIDNLPIETNLEY